MLRTTPSFMRRAALAVAMLLVSAAGHWAEGIWSQGARAQQASGAPSTPFQPVAVVNGSAITGFDLAQRAQIMSLLGFPADNKDALRKAALDRLIEDRLKMQEAKRLDIKTDPEQIQAGIEELARNVGAKPDEMLAVLSTEGVSQEALKDMITADVVWRQVVRTRFSRRIEPGEAEIDAEIARVQDRAGQTFHIAEIGLPLEEDGRSAAETRALAEQLSERLSRGGDFGEAVRRYSRAPSASKDGDIGWVTTAALPPRIADELRRLEPGDVSKPVEVSGGLSILKVLERRDSAADNIDTSDPDLRERVRNRLVNQQGARLAEGLLQELRRDALIEMR